MSSTKVAMGEYYPIANAIPGVRQSEAAHWRAKPTGEKRPPLKGEWYLSGSIISAYRMPSEGSTMDFHIAELVPGRMQVISIWEVADCALCSHEWHGKRRCAHLVMARDGSGNDADCPCEESALNANI